jgi:hypothetical protein
MLSLDRHIMTGACVVHWRDTWLLAHCAPVAEGAAARTQLLREGEQRVLATSAVEVSRQAKEDTRGADWQLCS